LAGELESLLVECARNSSLWVITEIDIRIPVHTDDMSPKTTVLLINTLHHSIYIIAEEAFNVCAFLAHILE
jgi:hypothetical protein